MIAVTSLNRFISSESTKSLYKRGVFPDGTVKMDMSDELPSIVRPIIIWRYESDSEMFEIMCLAKHLHKSSSDVSLIMPYIPYARMDRVKHNTEIFTLKYFCELINSLDFERVIVLDPHSDVSAALINNVECFYPKFEKTDDYDFFCYPDNGSAKKYSSIYNKPYVYCVKNRDWETGKIIDSKLELNGQNIEGKKVLIVDDICCKGGTFLMAAEHLKNEGASVVDLRVSHCEKSIFDGQILTSDLISQVYTYDPLYDIFLDYHDKIIQLDYFGELMSYVKKLTGNKGND